MAGPALDTQNSAYSTTFIWGLKEPHLRPLVDTVHIPNMFKRQIPVHCTASEQLSIEGTAWARMIAPPQKVGVWFERRRTSPCDSLILSLNKSRMCEKHGCHAKSIVSTSSWAVNECPAVQLQWLRAHCCQGNGPSTSEEIHRICLRHRLDEQWEGMVFHSCKAWHVWINTFLTSYNTQTRIHDTHAYNYTHIIYIYILYKAKIQEPLPISLPMHDCSTAMVTESQVKTIAMFWVYRSSGVLSVCTGKCKFLDRMATYIKAPSYHLLTLAHISIKFN